MPGVRVCRLHHTPTQAHPKHYPTTPAMAAGVADHVWRLEEVVRLLKASEAAQGVVGPIG
jgi:hypothetical protein